MTKTSFPELLTRLTQKRSLPLHFKALRSLLLVVGVVMLMLVSCISSPTATVGPIATATIGSSPAATIKPSPTAMAVPSQIPLVPTKPRPPAGWEHRWLKGVPCEPPCWEGVIPGRTTASDAVALLNHSPIVLTAELTHSIITGHGLLIWQWLNDGRGGQANYYTLPITTNEAIYFISLFYPTPFTLREVIQAYGEPSDVLARAYRNPDGSIASDVGIYYRVRGLGLGAATMGKVDLNLDMPVWVAFFEPTDEGIKTALGGAADHPDWLMPWQGIKDFEFYCKDSENGRACRGEP